MHHYPTELPTDDLKNIYAFVTGQNSDKGLFVESAWWVAGYAASVLVPDAGHPVVFSTSIAEEQDLRAAIANEIAHHMVAIADGIPSGTAAVPKVAAVAKIDWGNLLGLLMKFLPIILAFFGPKPEPQQ